MGKERFLPSPPLYSVAHCVGICLVWEFGGYSRWVFGGYGYLVGIFCKYLMGTGIWWVFFLSIWWVWVFVGYFLWVFGGYGYLAGMGIWWVWLFGGYFMALVQDMIAAKNKSSITFLQFYFIKMFIKPLTKLLLYRVFLVGILWLWFKP